MTPRNWAGLAATALIFLLTVDCRAQEGEGPQPAVVTPGEAGQPPAGAVVVFSGKDLNGVRGADGGPSKCAVTGGAMACRTGSGDVFSIEKYRDAQIHLEFAIPHMPDQKGQLRGNSGAYIQACWEVQILDSYRNPTYANGSCGAIYGVAAPLVNASKPPEQWQTYDILFRSPRCDAGGNITQPGEMTVFHNGVLIHDHVKLPKPGPGCSQRSVCEPGPLRLQDHSGFPGAPDTTMKFRNIWFRRLE